MNPIEDKSSPTSSQMTIEKNRSKRKSLASNRSKFEQQWYEYNRQINDLEKKLDDAEKQYDQANDEKTKKKCEAAISYFQKNITIIREKLPAIREPVQSNKKIKLDNLDISPESLKGILLMAKLFYKSKGNEFKVVKHEKRNLKEELSKIVLEVQHAERLKIIGLFFFEENFGIDPKSVKFEFKDQGVQEGTVAVANGRKFYIKTHQNGFSSSSASSDLVDLRELLVYKFFEFIDIGPNISFYFNQADPKEFFIVSEEIKNFKTFKELTDEDQFFDQFKSNESYQEGIILADIISKILNLQDFISNDQNFGFQGERVKFLDFVIREHLNERVVEEFQKQNISLNTNPIPKIFGFDMEKKNQLGRQFMQCMIREVSGGEQSEQQPFFIQQLNRARNFVFDYFKEKKIAEKLHDPKDLENFAKNQQKCKKYEQICQKNFESFCKHFNSL